MDVAEPKIRDHTGDPLEPVKAGRVSATLASEVRSEEALLALCVRLGASTEGGESLTLPRRLAPVPDRLVDAVVQAIWRGEDPLGERFCTLRSAKERRGLGATYTPETIVDAMVCWAKQVGTPARVVDPGTGSGRFLLAAARAFPEAELVGVDVDPFAAMMARANLSAAGLADRAEIRVADYRDLDLPRADGATLFLGNPPYVRHHEIPPKRKAWLTHTARAYGLPVSQLAGLHLHFFVATLQHAQSGDFGTFITASEWLDVNYGALARSLFAGPLGLERLDLLEPTAMPFSDAQTTAAITGFRIGARGSAQVRRVKTLRALGTLSGGRRVARRRLAETRRWTALTRPQKRGRSDLVELGEICRVHRGQVTGCNRVWIAGDDTPQLPASVLQPAITRAKELFEAGPVLEKGSMLRLRRVVELPADLGELAGTERRLVARFLDWARTHGAHESYIARHRSPWWRVKLRDPAPILATYMARRPPAFVRNKAGAKHINIAHGIYPREKLPDECLDALARYLAEETLLSDGRTYAGGLTKFEPREMERLLVPMPEALVEWFPQLGAA